MPKVSQLGKGSAGSINNAEPNKRADAVAAGHDRSGQGRQRPGDTRQTLVLQPRLEPSSAYEAATRAGVDRFIELEERGLRSCVFFGEKAEGAAGVQPVGREAPWGFGEQGACPRAPRGRLHLPRAQGQTETGARGPARHPRLPKGAPWGARRPCGYLSPLNTLHTAPWKERALGGEQRPASADIGFRTGARTVCSLLYAKSESNSHPR